MEITRFLYALGELGDGAIAWISTAASLLSIIGVFVKKHNIKNDTEEKRKNKNTWKTIGLIVLAVSFSLVAFVTYVGQHLVEVPNVVGYLYEDARHVLVENNLKYSVLVDNGIYIESQNPEAGTIVAPGTTVKLIVNQTSSSEEAIAYFEDQINAREFGNLELQFYDAQIQVWDESGVIRCFGPDLNDFTVSEVYLLQEEYGVKYCEYSVESGKLQFSHIPVGIEYTLFVLLDGYEEAECCDIILSSANMTGNTFSLNLGLTKTSREYLPATSFRVADSAGNFLSGVKFQIKFSWADMWYGDYVSNSDGSFPYVFWLSEEQSVSVCVVEPFKNAQDIYCSIMLNKFEVGSMADDAVIIIADDGTYKVVTESDYFGY